MKHAPHIYAESFCQALAAHPGKEREQVKRLVALLEKNGDRSSVHKVIEAIERKLVRERGGSFVELQSARPLAPAVVESFRKISEKRIILKRASIRRS
jgi:hypothetical protein